MSPFIILFERGEFVDRPAGLINRGVLGVTILFERLLLRLDLLLFPMLLCCGRTGVIVGVSFGGCIAAGTAVPTLVSFRGLHIKAVL